MARVVEENWSGELSGLVVVPPGHDLPCRDIEVAIAAHPVPDAAGQDAAHRILDLVRRLGKDDLALCLFSGGGSSLLTLPAAGIKLAQLQQLNEMLLRCGATIAEINCVRKHLSAIKGGRLAVACHPARVLNLLISDVPDDDPASIASGPTVADPTTLADARAVLDSYGIRDPAPVIEHLRRAEAESPKPDSPRLVGIETLIVATAADALEAAAASARAAGIMPIVLGDRIEADASPLAREHAEAVFRIARTGDPGPLPCVLLSGGETTVTIRGPGRGGRNSEYLLALAIALDGLNGVHALACDTDGIDGSGDHAGAVIGPGTLSRATSAGRDARRDLADNDSYRFFAALGDLIRTGPTRTNVGDFRAILITADAGSGDPVRPLS
jgi:hydroxypyruvate reductase